MQCIDLGLDFFLVRFKLNEDYWHVVNDGPWFVRQQFLIIRCWTPGFRPSEAKISTTTVWARLPELPLELYDAGILSRIGNQLGSLLKINARTVDNARGCFARLCVQIDLGQPLTPLICVGHVCQRVQYEGISQICFECGCMGHRSNACPTIIRPNPFVAVPPPPDSEPTPPLNSKPFGEWMLVSR